MNIIGRTTGLLSVSNVIKNLQHNPRLTSTCTSTVSFVLFVRTAVKATHSKSRLEQHQITHQKELNYMCKHKGCSQGFKNKGDYNRHMLSHDDICFKCTSCPYKNKDKRNGDSHMRTHQEKGIGLECYHCECCGKVMWFSTQLKRHRVTRCDVLDLHVETSKGDSKTP